MLQINGRKGGPVAQVIKHVHRSRKYFMGTLNRGILIIIIIITLKCVGPFSQVQLSGSNEN